MPIVTPLTPQHTLDVKGLECLLKHVTDGNVHGICDETTMPFVRPLEERQREMIDATLVSYKICNPASVQKEAVAR